VGPAAGNDSDPDAGTLLTIQAVEGAARSAALQFDPATKTLRYVAMLTASMRCPRASVVDRFSYTVTDGNGQTSTPRSRSPSTASSDTLRLNGGNGAIACPARGGEDVLAAVMATMSVRSRWS
jgi:hypothetical protein